jgi:AraC family transcriptional regulator
MPRGHDQAKNASCGSDVRIVGRLCELPEGIGADYSTDGIGCRGISAQVHRIRSAVNVATFAFQDLSVAFLHRGTINASFEHESVVHTFGQSGLVILPAGSKVTLTLSDADCTVIYLKPEQIPGSETERFARLEIVPQIDPVDLTTTFLIACIREELQSGLLGGPRLMESLGLSLVNHIYARHSKDISPKTAFRGGLTARQVRRAQEIMMEALDESVPLATLAEDAKLSPWYFCRAFKQSTGWSPHRWMREQRLDRARQLLAEDHRTLTSIAIDLGFASLSHFSAAFKQATGISPTHYRRNLAS